VSVRSSLRRIVLVLPLVLAASAMPVTTVPRRPHVTLRTMALRARGVLRAPVDFGLVGVSWPAGDVTPRAVRLRTSSDGKHWSSWNDVEIATDEGPDPGTHEAHNASTSPLWVGHARYVDVGWDGAMPQNAKVAVVDPGPDPAAPPASSAEASPAAPHIITRAQWGADESIRRGKPEYAEPLQMAFIHHTASSNDYSASQSAAIVRSIYAFHVQGNGWNDIGYNFLVDRYGQIFEGRYGGMTRSLIGAHTLGFNAHSTGISVIGTFNAAAPPAAAMNAVKQLLAWRLDVAYIDPGATTTMVSNGNPRYVEGTRVNLRTISGHRDVYDTDCPGAAFYAQLPPIRSAVAAIGDPKLYNLARSASVITPNSDGIDESSRVTMRFSSTVTWTIDVLDPAGKKWFGIKGSGTSASGTWNGHNGATLAPPDSYHFLINAQNSQHGPMRPVVVPVGVLNYPDGTLLRTASGWTGTMEGGKLRHFLVWRALQSRYRDAEIVAAPDALLTAYPKGADIGFRDGSVVRMGTSTWIISDATRRPVDPATLTAMGYQSGSIIDTSSTGLAPTPEGTPVTAAGGYPNGTALVGSDNKEAMVLSGLARPFLSANVRQSYTIRDVDLAGPADSQLTQAQSAVPVGFRDGSLLQATGDPAVYVVVDGVRRHISSYHLFVVLGYKASNIRPVTAAELALNPQGTPL